MDIDAFIAVNHPTWDRLEQLVRIRRPDADEIDELIALYERTATHLSTVRSTDPDPALTARLSMLLNRARSVITGARTPALRSVRDFFWDDLPAALWSARTPTMIAAGILLGSTLLTALLLGFDDDLRASLMPEHDQQALAEQHFVSYYFQGMAAGFTANVWTNNAWIALQAVVLGITGFWPVWMLLQNGFNLGASAAVMGSHDRLGTFFVYILPHGMLELTCVVVAAGAGLRLFWSWVRPGDLPRTWALARAARSLVTVAIGLVPVLLIAGLIEGFVTPSALPAPIRLLIGALALAAFLVYAYGRGRAAARAGITGDLSEEQVGDRVAVAA